MVQGRNMHAKERTKQACHNCSSVKKKKGKSEWLLRGEAHALAAGRQRETAHTLPTARRKRGLSGFAKKGRFKYENKRSQIASMPRKRGKKKKGKKKCFPPSSGRGDARCISVKRDNVHMCGEGHGGGKKKRKRGKLKSQKKHIIAPHKDTTITPPTTDRRKRKKNSLIEWVDGTARFSAS